MNQWVEKSMLLAQKEDYLDELAAVYPINVTVSEKANNDYKKVRNALKKKDRGELMRELLKFERFPVDDPYVGFFRKDKGGIERNPKTTKRITNDLFNIGSGKIIVGIERSKSPSRQFGQLFRHYVKKLGYKVFSDPKKFLASKRKVAFLDGGDEMLKNFAKNELGFKGEKGLDLVFRIKGKYFIGESKFISVGGGTQNGGFREALAFIKKTSGSAQRIAILDGIIWLTQKKVNKKKKINKKKKGKKKKGSLYGQLFKVKPNQVVMSALLFKNFIKSL